MSDYTDYSHDPDAMRAYERIRTFLREPLRVLFPGHELQRVGINRDFNTDRLELRLHLHPDFDELLRKPGQSNDWEGDLLLIEKGNKK